MIQEPNIIPHLSTTYDPQHLITDTGAVIVTDLDSLPTIRTNQNRPIVINLKSNQKILVITTTPATTTTQVTQNQVQANRQQQQRQNPIIISKRKHLRSVPFLPRSEPTTFSVKKTLPIKKNLNLLNSTVETPLSALPNTQLIEIPTVNTRTSETGTRHHPNYITCKPVNLTGHNSNANYSSNSYCSEYITVSSPPQSPQSQQSQQSQANPSTITTTTARQATLKTLTSMAGIQLTGADESLLDMSGAMPTATVEEINVPVFIDEYLQQSTPTTSTTTAEATATFSNSNNNNNYNSNSNGNGNDFCIHDDEEFEFDIDMIAGRTGADVLQTLYYTNNSGNCNSSSSSSSNSCEGYYDNNSNNIYNITTATNYDEMNTNNTIKFEGDESNEMCSLHRDLDDSIDEPEWFKNEEAVDFNLFSHEDMTLDTLMNSQCDPMLSDTIPPSTNNSQTFSIADALPVVPDYDENDATLYDSQMSDYPIQHADGGGLMKMEIEQQQHENHCNVYKKKLYLNISTENFITVEDQRIPDTPDIIRLISECNDNDTQKVPSKTIEQLQAEFSEMASVGYDEGPYTPQSCTSSSYTHHTNHTDCNTSPNSPALSIISSGTTTRKKRGRPSKTQSDPLPLDKLEKLTPAERKRVEDRVKNNEASRISRQKNKKREEDEIKEESELQQANDILKAQSQELERIEEKLKKYLFQNRK